jgi:riboflavin kinase/FMN adenylyltransferase
MLPQVHHGSESVPPELRFVLTIGNFDGVHRGHLRLLKRLVERAHELGHPSCVYTFEPAPHRVLQPDRAPPRILSIERKLELLGAAGVDHVVLEAFDLELGAQSPEWFADTVILERLNPVAMVVGYDFRYGNRRAGNVETLRAHVPQLPIEAVDALDQGGDIVSSSKIRESVAEGRVADAARMLGRPYRLTGTVVPGDQRGRGLGFPTANLDVDQELLPAFGVYAVTANVEGQPAAPAVANLGLRPTFGASRFAVEVHLLDQDVDLYGQRIQVNFIARIRPEQRFAGAAELVARIGQDVAQARELLA